MILGHVAVLLSLSQRKKHEMGIYLALYGNVAFIKSQMVLSVRLFANDVIITVVCPLYLRKCRQTYPI